MIWQMFSFSIQKIMPLKKLVKAKKAVFVKKIIILTYAISCFGKKKFSFFSKIEVPIFIKVVPMRRPTALTFS